MKGVMPDESESSKPVHFVRVVLPWLLAGGMGALYLVTLHHWVSPESLWLVANVSGLNFHAELFGPLTYMVTWPFRWLPPAWIPPALNLFAAGCATLSLAWLARTVALLPHDRTTAQRQRLQGESPWLAIRAAWLAPAVAVLVCGLQLTFWENAIAATGEMFNLVLFAWLVRCLVELRADENTARLPGFALVYGLAVANDWAMVAFSPLFFLAAVWAARANPFTERFLERVLTEYNNRWLSMPARLGKVLQLFNPRLWAAILGCFLAGLSLLFLLPLLASWPDDAQTGFWPAVLWELHTYKRLLGVLPRVVVLLMCLSSVLPAIFMTLRWRNAAGGAGASARRLADGTFHFIHGFFLAACLWAALDFPLSPRRLGAGFCCLPLYYLGALSVGYFSGYFLLVFGAPRRDAKRRPRPLARAVSQGLAVATWVALLAVPAALLWKNLPHILTSRHGAFESYTAQLERSLPPPGAAVLNDDPLRLLCLQTTLMRRGQQASYLTIDDSLLAKEPGYIQFLQERFPEAHLAPPVFHLPSDLTNRVVLTAWLQDLAATRELYYLSPVADYLGESFSLQQRGLFYQLKPRGSNILETQPLPPQVLAENRDFWRAFAAGPLSELTRYAQPPEPTSQPSLAQRLLRLVYVKAETDRWAVAVGSWCSQALDAWGVELQKVNETAEAGACFRLALLLSPDNAAARINRDFNQTLQAHQPATLQSAQELEARFGKRRSWAQILSIDGPIDEPNACYGLGKLFAEVGWPRQAAREFARAEVLAPGYADADLGLAEQLIALADYTNALAKANEALQLNPGNTNGLFLKGYSLLLLKDYQHAIPPLSDLLAVHTSLPARLLRAYAYLQLGKLDAARQDYERAERSTTNAYLAYYGLAEVAYRNKDTAAAIKYGELYQSNAPPNLGGAPIIQAHLAELLGGNPATPKP
jgi:tetratricopeptide (TPR) repeat protein